MDMGEQCEACELATWVDAIELLLRLHADCVLISCCLYADCVLIAC